MSRAAVTQACREGGPLHAAVVGTKVDARDPITLLWLAEGVRGPDGEASVSSTDVLAPSRPSDDPVPTKEDLLRIRRRKQEAEARRLELANAITEGKVISRELVHVHVFGALELLSQRLLRDVPKAITPKLFAIARSQAGGLEDAEKEVREHIGSNLRHTKDTMIRLLADRRRAAKRRSSAPAPGRSRR